VVRGGALCGLMLGACLAFPRAAAAEVTLLEHDGWTFFTDGRVNAFVSQTFGDDFPQPTHNPDAIDPTTGMAVPQPQHTVIGSGQPFTAGFPSDQGDPNGKVSTARIRSGFLGSIIAFGMKRQLTEWTSVKAYMSLWATVQSYARDRSQDYVRTSEGFDAREGWIAFEGQWGKFIAGRQSGILGGISTEIDFLYAHNYGLGLPCLDVYYPSCGHIGTGALGPGFAAGFVYTTPTVLGGLRLTAGLYDPVRLLGAWERTPYPRPEGTLTYDRKLNPWFNFKLAVEGMYQPMYKRGTDPNSVDPTTGLPNHDAVWGVAGGGRVEIGPFRLGLSAFRGKGLGTYVALQNAMSTFSGIDLEFRYFTGLYGQTAVVFGREQISFGVGRVMVDQLQVDKTDYLSSQLKNHTGISAGFFHAVTENLVLGLDYFMFRTDWWGAPTTGIDATGMMTIGPGRLPGEKQVINFINVGATFIW
jgi:hypothetical protein